MNYNMLQMDHQWTITSVDEMFTRELLSIGTLIFIKKGGACEGQALFSI